MNEAGLGPMPKMLTVDEFAALMRVSPVTVRRWARDGHVQSVKPGGRRTRTRRIPETEVQRLQVEMASSTATDAEADPAA